ncbi:MAG TPA: LCP family protein [Candidatus Limnocylindria bacterium]|nr:LCP family protein [Candidatus Limnocylindria bacterium]
MTATTPPPPPTTRGRTPWLLIAGVVALAIIAGVLGFMLLGKKPAVPLASQTPVPTPEPTLNAALLDQRMTVLLLGLDSDERRRQQDKGVNSDTIMVASINADQSEVALVSLPRDTVDIPLPDGTTWTQKVNAIYSQQGAAGVQAAVESLLRIDINYYVQIDMGDLADMVDAVGGVRVRPKEPLVDDHLKLNLRAGPQVLDGKTAEAYVRSRYTTNDFERAGRQQEVLLQIVKKLVAAHAGVDIGGLLDSLASFDSDLPIGDMPTLVELARRAQSAKVVTRVLDPNHGFITFAGDQGDGRGYVLEPNIDAMRQFAARHLRD